MVGRVCLYAWQCGESSCFGADAMGERGSVLASQNSRKLETGPGSEAISTINPPQPEHRSNRAEITPSASCCKSLNAPSLQQVLRRR